MEKLIRFDWAIKKILRNKANFTVLEGFLTAMFQEDVTVVHILESEGNREDATDKFNRVDLLVRNAKDELILIEVQVQAEYDFFQRISYGVSKLITEYIEQGQPYKDIKKVISVSVCYFNLGAGDDYLYYGSTQFIGMHKQDRLQLTDKQHDAFGTGKVHKLFPEYYIIRVEKFPDEIHQAVDEWIYMLKHSEIKPEFTSRHIQDASEKLRIMNLDDTQRKAYESYMQDVSYSNSMLWSSREQGKYEEKCAIARNLLACDVSFDIITASTGLSREEIVQLKEE